MGSYLRVNGIFKGGGAKGIMYAGALYEIYDRGYWFRAVAGSSAGAPSVIMSCACASLAGLRRRHSG
jgi:predicted acylesterase/phospholipase RssA